MRLATGWALAATDADRVEAWIEPGNEPSQRVLEAACFTREGVLRSYLAFGPRRADAVVFSRVASD